MNTSTYVPWACACGKGASDPLLVRPDTLIRCTCGRVTRSDKRDRTAASSPVAPAAYSWATTLTNEPEVRAAMEVRFREEQAWHDLCDEVEIEDTLIEWAEEAKA